MRSLITNLEPGKYEKRMKPKTIRCLSLIIMIGSVATAQQPRASLICSGPPGPPITEAVNWSQFHFDLGHTGCNPYEHVLSPANVGNLGPKWKLYSFGQNSSFSSPAVVNGVVYIGTENRGLYALDASTGAVLWDYAMQLVESSPAVANGVVYVGSHDNNVYALNASTGVLVEIRNWAFRPFRAGGGQRYRVRVGWPASVRNGRQYRRASVDLHHRRDRLVFAGRGERRGVHRVLGQ